MAAVKRIAPAVTRKLKQFGPIWPERVEVLDTIADPPRRRWYDFVYREFRTTAGTLELRLQYVQEKDKA